MADDIEPKDDGEDSEDNGRDSVPHTDLEEILGGETADEFANVIGGAQAIHSDEPPNSDAFPIAWKLHQNLSNFGHLHVRVDGEPHEVELSAGNATFNYNTGIISVWASEGQRYVQMDRIVSWYEPNDFYHTD